MSTVEDKYAVKFSITGHLNWIGNEGNEGNVIMAAYGKHKCGLRPTVTDDKLNRYTVVHSTTLALPKNWSKSVC